MLSDGDSFLPRIQSVFYAVFDDRHGPDVVYQVPEGLIGVTPPSSLSGNISASSNSSTDLGITLTEFRHSNSSLASPAEQGASTRSLNSPQKRGTSASRTLFNFDEISKYVIPPSQLCGRLVTCATRKYRIIGFPVELEGNYDRVYLRYNLCFVFERSADLSCYEPIVRKVSRVLTACEKESAFLSSSDTSPAIHAILEQLYEDLNSYSETSIPIDRFNSIELKILPFYPNPPATKDWMVPVALINLSKRIESNWDLTMVKVCQFIDGTNHVSRIAQLADCDLDLTRQAIAHLLYYQVIMTIDIFQYSNMYTLRESIQWLADEAHVKEECGPYVTKPGRDIPDWPKLLHLYSRLKAGKTVLEWMSDHDVHALNVDVRRFMSFGVIKGFLRRVHRWPILLQQDIPQNNVLDSTSFLSRRRTVPSTAVPNLQLTDMPSQYEQARRGIPSRLPQTTPLPGSEVNNHQFSSGLGDDVGPLGRRASAAEQVLEQLRTLDIQKSASSSNLRSLNRKSVEPRDGRSQGHSRGHSESRRHSIISQGPPSPTISFKTSTPFMHPARPILSRSPSVSNIPPLPPQHMISSPPLGSAPSYPPELLPLLDGEHHTDELATRFEVGWPTIEKWLVIAGGGIGDGDAKYGNVSIIYR